MKKIFNVITLIVMVSVNVLTPFTYADSFGDVFVETQEIDEVVAENGDFSDEEEIDEISDEDQDDEIDIDKDENESDETDEDSESDEDDTSEEQTEEEGEQTEEEGEQTEEEGEQTEEEQPEEAENLIDENNENEEGDTQDSNPDEQSTIDVQNDEDEENENDFSDEDYSETPEESPIDAVKESIESFSGNILTGDIEFLTGKILTGEVVELTGNDLELSLARETLNEDLIQKSEYYNGVSVNVEAQPGTFPQGTELRINPITLKKELNEIKEQIIDSQENVSEESELVAFDISFIYVLSGGEEIEVQPKNGDGVKVVFNYENNENLSEADNNDEQKVKVFHIDDKDENGEKVVQGEEIVKDVTNRVESEEAGIAVADAESFSIYAVVATSGNGLRVTYDLNGGYWVENHDTNPKTVIYTGTETNMFYKTPSNTGFMFMGWYLTGLTTRRNGSVTDDTTVYAKWEPFYDLYTYILIDQDNIVHKTIMDRNVGATEIYNQNYNKQNTASYGYYFQRGNNYGIGNSSDVDWANNYTVPSRIWSLGISSKYYSRKLRSNDKKNWMDSTTNSAGLWGGTGDTATTEGVNSTLEGRQGPCPEGYHVPSTVSWQQLFYDWNQIYNYDYDGTDKSKNIDNIRIGLGTTFLFSPAGRYGGNSLGQYGIDISYWSSSEVVNKKNTAHGFYMGYYGIQPDGIGNTAGEGDFKSRGRPVRCFKNDNSSYLGNIVDLNGGTGGIISIVSGEIIAFKKPTRGIDTFGGWYTSEDFSGDAIESVGDNIPQGVNLYAKWDCGSGYVDDGGECVEGFKITFNASKNGGTTTAEDIVVTGSAATKTINLADYTAEKEGYYFVGWNTDAGADTGLQGQQTFTQNTKLYAIFLNLYTYRFEDTNGTFLGTGYYQSGVEMNMTKLIPLSYYTGGKTADLSGYEDLFTLGLTPEEKLTHGIKWTPEIPDYGIATEDLVITGEKLEAFDVRFLNYDDSDFIRHRVVSGTILQEPETYPREHGLQFEGWYTDDTYATEFEFPVNVTADIIIYSKFIDVYCEFKTSAVGTTGLKITEFSGTQTEECLTNFVIPSEINGKTVVEIGQNAFKGDKSGAQIISGEITLPDTLTTIGNSAFYKNNISGKLIIPNSVTSIGNNAFENNQITGLELGNSVQTIQQYAFNKNKLTGELIIPNSVTSIGNNAFDGNNDGGNKISGKLVIPNSVTSIGNSAFRKNQITGLELGNSVVTIGNSAFYSNKITGKLEIPDSVVTIEDSAFMNNQITGLELGNSVVTIGDSAFENNQLTGYLEIPDSVITIKIDAFKSNQLSGVTIGNSVTKIDNYAFYNNKLTGKLEIPDSVITIGNYAFCDPDNYGVGQGNELTEVVIGNGVISIGVGAFFNNQITGLVLGSSVENIQDTAFRRNKIEGELIIPDSVKFIGSYAFGNNMISGVSGTLLFPGNINTGVMNNAFRENPIENLIIGTGITYIADQSFGQSDTRNLIDGKHIIKTVFFPETLTGIGNYAFNVQEIEELNLPNSLETIGKNAFDKTQISGTLVLPDNLVSIDEYAFSNQHISGTYCVSNEVRNSNLSVCTLKSVILNDNLQSIGTGVFAANDIKSVYIPDSVTYLAYRAFDQGGTRGHIYLTGYVTTKKPELDYTGAYVKPLYQLYTYTFKDELGNTVGTGYYPEILESNTTKVIPLNYYNGIGNVEDFTGVDSLIPHGAGEVVTWSEPLSEHTIVTGNLIVTGSTSALHSVTFKNPFTGDIVEYIPNNQYVSEPEEFVVQGYTFTGWYNGDVKFDFDTPITSDLILTGRYDTNKYTLSFYSDKGKSELLSGIVYDYNTTINTQPIEDPTKTNYDFAGWKNVTGDADVVFPLTITGDLDIYANWEDPTKEWIGWDGCYQYRTYTGEVNDTIEYYAEITAYSGAASCPRENLTMPNVITRNDRNYTIKSIGGGAFSAKYLSGTITLPNSLETIGGASFYNNPNITSVIISEGVTSIGDEAFRYNSGLTGIVLPSTLTTIGYSAFESAGLESVIIPDSVVEIKSSAFSYNTHLKSVKIGDGLTTLNSAVFQYCNELETVELGDGLETIRSAFAFDTKLKNIIWGNNVKNIYGGAFYDTAIEEVILPDSVTFIDGGAFGLNSKLKTIKLGTGLITLNGGVFNNSTGIENIDLGNVETIRVGNFENTQITGLVIPDTVTYIEGGAFGSNSKLKTVKIGTGLKILNYGVFNNSTGIENVDLGKLETINPNNFSGTQITGLVIPDTVTYISNGAFSNNTKLERVIFTGESQIQSIGAGAFSYSALTGINLPNSLTTLGTGVFCTDDGTNTGTVIGFIGDDPSVSAETLEAQDDTACFVIKKSIYNISTGSNDETQGSVSVYGEPRYGKRIEFRANVYDTSLYKFVKWELNGKDVMTGDNQFWTGDLVIENLTGDLIVTGHFAAYSGCSWSGGEIAHGTSVTGYLTPTVSYGETCVSEIRTCNDGTLSGTYEYASCTPEGASSCDLPWGGTVPDGTSVTGYKTSSEKCPDECESVIAICNNGNWNVENFTGIYTEPSCVTQPVSTEGYDLDECPEHGICSSITGYTVSENVCIKGDEKFKLDGCDAHYHTGSDNKSCEIDKFDIVWNYRDENGTRTGETIKIEYGKNPTEPTLPEISQTAQTGYTFSGWTPEVSSPVTTGAEYTAQYNETTREYLITFLDGDGEIIQTGMVAYGATPAYTGSETPKKTSTAQTGYTFSGWSPSIHEVEGEETYTAQFEEWTRSYDITWKYTTQTGTQIETGSYLYGAIPSHSGNNYQTAQTGYTFIGWEPEIEEVTGPVEYTAQYNETTREYLITFLDGDGEIIQTGMVAYGVKPSYTGETPTKTATAQYSYSFNNTWEPEIVPVTTGAEYTAQFDSILNKYTVTIKANTNSGSVSTGSVTENWGSLITESENELTIGDTTVIATAKTGDAQYTHEFSRWNNTCGDKVETGCSIEAEFTSTIREYTITFHSNGGSVVTGQTKQYGSHVDEPADPTRQGYGFSGWYSNISLTQKYNFTETVTGDLDLYAKWTPITYTIGYELNGGILPAGQENPTTYTIESNDITLKNPTKIGYIFSGWTGTDLSTESTEVTIASGSMGDRVYYANWQPDNVNVTVYYFTQKLNPSTNELIDEFDTHDIRIVQMQSDLEFNIYNEFYKPIEGFEYVRATVTEQDTSEHTETTTTVLPNGSRVINLYYTRGQYNFAIIPVDNVTTQGSSENSGYYYGATITLSGSSSNDCFMWSGWINLPEGTINNSQTSFTMPANAISLSGVVTEKTYNISFNGNGADEGEMETLNGISCTQSIYLPINKFKKVGHTFTGWTTTIDGSKEYNDGARIQALTTGNNTTVNLIAVWDINKYDIVWKNYNGETLDSQILEYGVIPEYGGEHPLRDPDIQFSYSFSGWTPEIQRVEGPQVYTAVYSTTLNEYTITWDVDGTITTETYEYGAIPYFSGSKGKVPDKQYIYTFSGWTPQISPVSGNITYTATYTATLRKYTVTWINSNGDVLETDENVPYGTTPTYDGPTPTKEGDTEHHYTFAGWAPAVGPISGDTTYEAIFDSTKKEYTIIWQNENGGILETDENVPYGTTPTYDGPTPTKASDPHYSYEFAGWTPETGAVVGHQTYTATYTAIPRKYTVTWKNSNGSVIRTDTGVEYGTTLEYQGPTPTSGGNAQYSYEFTGWNPAIGEIHGDTTYTAVYTHKTNKYTITWKNRDGTVIKTVTGVEYGATPIYGDVSPTKTGDAQYSYEFIGWEPGISTVTGDTSYTAKFKENLNRYKVIFINDDSGILKEATEYDYGTSRDDIEKPADPTKASDVQYSYEFAGWEPSISVLTGDITFKATYTSTVNKYTVTWKNRNGSIIKTNTGVEYGTEPEYDGPTPTKESTSEYSYRFTGWEPAIGEIHGDTTYTAQFEPILESYTITWKDRDGKVLKVDENVPYGATPVYSGDNPSRSGNIQYDYIFDGWTPSLAPVHGDATYTAKYRSELKKYKVIWKNWDDEVLETDENVLYGSTPKYDGEEPTKPGSPQYSYVFDRWTPNIHAVDGDVVYKAVFEELINKYTVTWENWDESVIKTDTGVEYGTVLEYDGPTPTKEGDAQYSYEFSGWDNEIKAIHEDTTYRATYIQSVNEYLITFLDGDGKTIQTGMVAYGATPNYTGSTPTKTKTQEYTYTFNNTWSPEIHSVGGEETYTAQFNSTKNKYTITINANTNSGSINTGLITAEYGTPIIESGNELKIGDTTVIATAKPSDAQYTHEFSGWNNTCGLTLNDGCTIEAEFRSTVNKYLITFLDGDGKTIQTGMVAYGATPNYTGSTPTKTKTQEYTYTFNNTWSPAIHSVTTGETYTAQFNSTKNKYTITINANTNSGSINTGLITAEYGTSITESGNELKIGDTTIIATAKPSDAQYTHEFSGWNNTCGLTLNDGCIIEAEFRSIIHKYTVIWNNEDGVQLEKDENVPYGTMPQYNGTTPVKPGDGSGAYVFDGWNPNPTIVVGNVEYTAKYKEKTSPQDDNTGNRRSGGGRRHYPSDDKQHGSAEDIDNPSDSEKEVFDAYKRAYKYGITTIDNEQEADPDGYVTRGHLAKMVVNFTVNALGREMPVDTPTKCKRKDKDSEWESNEIKFYAEKACALGVMGLYTEEFMPNKIVDRAEFGTVISRLLWGNRYDELDTDNNLFYTKHLKALQESGFMKDIDNPLGRKEFRKRVWVTLKRIELEKNKK